MSRRVTRTFITFRNWRNGRRREVCGPRCRTQARDHLALGGEERLPAPRPRPGGGAIEVRVRDLALEKNENKSEITKARKFLSRNIGRDERARAFYRSEDKTEIIQGGPFPSVKSKAQ